MKGLEGQLGAAVSPGGVIIKNCLSKGLLFGKAGTSEHGWEESETLQGWRVKSVTMRSCGGTATKARR